MGQKKYQVEEVSKQDLIEKLAKKANEYSTRKYTVEEAGLFYELMEELFYETVFSRKTFKIFNCFFKLELSRKTTAWDFKRNETIEIEPKYRLSMRTSARLLKKIKSLPVDFSNKK